MKSVVFLVALGVVTSCATYTPPPKTKNIMYYEHPVHGEVTKESEVFAEASRACENIVYSSGVMIDEVLVTERSKLEEISNEHRKAYTSARLRNDMSVSGAYAGTQGALAVSTGNLNLGTSQNNSKKVDPVSYYLDYRKLDLPEHIDQIHALNKEHIECIKTDQQLLPTRIEMVNESTGEIIRSNSLKDKSHGTK